MSDTSIYISPLSQRYASKEMKELFSNDKKFKTWRRLWIALAQAEQELGLDISDEQIQELIDHKDDINYEVAQEREKIVRHDVMSHVYAYGVQAPKAKGIIHLGATSCYVGDNTDLIIMHEGLELIKKKLVNVLAALEHFALEYKKERLGPKLVLWSFLMETHPKPKRSIASFAISSDIKTTSLYLDKLILGNTIPVFYKR